MENMDYINPADGLLYCGKCHTQKQCRVTAFGRESIQYCICKCRQEQLAEEKVQFAEKEKQRRKNITAEKGKKVDLILEMQNGDRGRIIGSIKN